MTHLRVSEKKWGRSRNYMAALAVFMDAVGSLAVTAEVPASES